MACETLRFLLVTKIQIQKVNGGGDGGVADQTNSKVSQMQLAMHN